jgi:hypothetical protein
MSVDSVELFVSPAGGMWSGAACIVNGNQLDPTGCPAGLYDLVYTYTDSLGCTAMDTTTIVSDFCLGMNVDGDVSFTFFPNPANESFALTFGNDVSDVMIEITDAQGRVVLTQNENAVNAGAAVKVSVENLAAGTYLLNVTTNSSKSARVLIIE